MCQADSHRFGKQASLELLVSRVSSKGLLELDAPEAEARCGVEARRAQRPGDADAGDGFALSLAAVVDRRGRVCAAGPLLPLGSASRCAVDGGLHGRVGL